MTPAARQGRHARRHRRAGGFSLLEVLVAFAILAVSLGVLLQIFARAAAATAAAEGYSRAAGLAAARIAAVGNAIPLEPGSLSGEPEDGIAWEVTIAEADLGRLALGPGLGGDESLIPYLVTVTALWPDGDRARRLSLQTLRLGQPP